MEKTIFIHVGPPKTGNTSIHRFLSANRKILKEDGYLYPGNGIAHHDMASEFRRLTLTDFRNNRDLAINKYLDEINTSDFDKIILSSEHFEGLMRRNSLKKEIRALKEFLVPKFQVKIIFYVRRQDEIIESIYNESVRNIDMRSDKSFSEFIKITTESKPDDSLKTENISSFLNYYAPLTEWSDVFGKENIIVRCYEQEQLPKGIYHDFLDAIGLSLDGRYRTPENRMRESLSWDLIEIMRICNTQFKEDINFHKFLIKSFKKIKIGNNDKKQHLLSPQQRRDFIAFFDKSNAKIAREFLGRSDGRLFYAPLPDLQEPWEPYTGLTVEKIVPIFTQMLFNMDNQKHKLDDQIRDLKDQIQKLIDRSLKQRMIKIIKKIVTPLGLLPTMKYWYTRFHRT
jgi:hypothetical protein